LERAHRACRRFLLISCLAYSLALKMESMCSSEILGFLQTARVIIQKAVLFIVATMRTQNPTCYIFCSAGKVLRWQHAKERLIILALSQLWVRISVLKKLAVGSCWQVRKSWLEMMIVIDVSLLVTIFIKNSMPSLITLNFIRLIKPATVRSLRSQPFYCLWRKINQWNECWL
jgi:hypothetical protein